MKTDVDRWERSPRFWAIAVLTVAVCAAARFLLAKVELTHTLRVTVAVLPVPFLALFLLSFVRRIRRLDELQRKIQLEALAIAYALAILFRMTLGLLSTVIPLPLKEHWSYEHFWLYLLFFYFVGLAIARERYQ